MGLRLKPESFTVRKAKRNYWKHIIDGVSDDKSLYKVIGWHKLSPNLKSPPLEVNGVLIEDTMKKAEVLRSEVLERPFTKLGWAWKFGLETSCLARGSRTEYYRRVKHVSRG